MSLLQAVIISLGTCSVELPASFEVDFCALSLESTHCSRTGVIEALLFNRLQMYSNFIPEV